MMIFYQQKNYKITRNSVVKINILKIDIYSIKDKAIMKKITLIYLLINPQQIRFQNIGKKMINLISLHPQPYDKKYQN